MNREISQILNTGLQYCTLAVNSETKRYRFLCLLSMDNYASTNGVHGSKTIYFKEF
jgi:hypothetical protein